jgi:hypothetical protein
MQLRTPSDQLAGVCWLPRFIDKVRKFLDGTLPPEYALRLGESRAMDGVFLRHFGLTKQQVLEAVRASAGNDGSVLEWFRAQPGVTADRINKWNQLAPNIGRPGHLGHELFRQLVTEVYPGAPYTGVESVFEVIEADEYGSWPGIL